MTEDTKDCIRKNSKHTHTHTHIRKKDALLAFQREALRALLYRG